MRYLSKGLCVLLSVALAVTQIAGRAQAPKSDRATRPSIEGSDIYASGSERSIRGSGMNHMIATKTYKAHDTHGLTNVKAIATT